MALDEKGNEILRTAGDATVRYSYEVEGLPVFGPGAKTQVFVTTADGKPRITGAVHVWRELRGSRDVKLGSAKAALESALTEDAELRQYSERGHSIAVERMRFGYLALPAFVHQSYVFPAFQVEGRVRSPKDDLDYFHFGRYYHAIDPKEYRRIGTLADYLMTRN